MPVLQDSTLVNISGIAISFGIKAVLLVIVFIYSIFTVLIIRQVKSMERTVVTPLSGLITTIAVLHAAAAVSVLAAIIFFL